MKRLLFCFVCLFTLLEVSTLSSAQNRYEVRPLYPTSPTINPHVNTGQQPGSYTNPYIIQDLRTGRTYEMRSQNQTWGRGIRNSNELPGSYTNPWVVEER